ncbi:putative IS2 ORF [Klebsiella variicola]|uniref:IS2 ORF n=1 Tax=Klebsiella variicola TaxID=244366 RepID=A0ABD7P748_KLEVA|nr:putative IS2 ORF [Klebsiella variicola]SXF94335.1 putative IS2 ORF [Klebsiella variicola]
MAYVRTSMFLTYDAVNTFGIHRTKTFGFRLSAQKCPDSPVAIRRQITDDSMYLQQGIGIIQLEYPEAILPGVRTS